MNWVPNTKVMASGLGGTIAGLVIDVLEGRFQVTLATGEINAIVVFSALVVAYFMPEMNRKLKELEQSETLSTTDHPAE